MDNYTEPAAPSCFTGLCIAPYGEIGICNCLECGGELRQINGFWYHWTQFDETGNLISPERPQIEETERGFECRK